MPEMPQWLSEKHFAYYQLLKTLDSPNLDRLNASLILDIFNESDELCRIIRTEFLGGPSSAYDDWKEIHRLGLGSIPVKQVDRLFGLLSSIEEKATFEGIVYLTLAITGRACPDYHWGQFQQLNFENSTAPQSSQAANSTGSAFTNNSVQLDARTDDFNDQSPHLSGEAKASQNANYNGMVFSTLATIIIVLSFLGLLVYATLNAADRQVKPSGQNSQSSEGTSNQASNMDASLPSETRSDKSQGEISSAPTGVDDSSSTSLSYDYGAFALDDATGNVGYAIGATADEAINSAVAQCSSARGSQNCKGVGQPFGHGFAALAQSRDYWATSGGNASKDEAESNALQNCQSYASSSATCSVTATFNF